MEEDVETQGGDPPEREVSAVGPTPVALPGASDESAVPPEGPHLHVEQSDVRSQLIALAPMVFFDVLGPLAVYYVARAAGLSTVPALVVSGVLPSLGAGATVVRHHRLDTLGALVLSGIALGTIVGLERGSARLYLLDELVPTVVLGLPSSTLSRARTGHSDHDPVFWGSGGC